MEDRLYAQRYQQLVERLPGVVYRASIRSGDWHYVSPAIERVLGWTPEEWQSHARGRLHVRAMHPSRRARSAT